MATTEIQPQIESSWKEVLWDEFQKPYFKEIKDFLHQEKLAGKQIFPPGKFIFNAFNQTPFDRVKVVIIGQDPYHDDGQAHGLCFSVPDGIKAPPSLVNIFKELNNNLNIPVPHSGNLTSWAKQGVLLLNSILTVEAHRPASHSKIGWEIFTNRVISLLSDKRTGLIFLLWGRYAQQKSILIDDKKHTILTAAHPSPFSASKFFNCKHFSQVNDILKSKGLTPIDWNI